MIALIATMNVAEGKEDQFEQVMGELVAAVRANEAGNQLYTLTKDEEGQYHVLEIYDDEAALTAHGGSDHMKAAGPKFAGIMSGRPTLKRLSVIA